MPVSRVQNALIDVLLNESAVDGGSANPKALGNLRWPHTFRMKGTHLVDVDTRFPAFVDALSFGLGNPFHLPFPPKARLELGKDPQHVEKRLSGCRGGVNRLFGRLQMRALRLQFPHHVLQIRRPNGPGDQCA